MSKHFWEYSKLTPKRRKEVLDLIEFAYRERFWSFSSLLYPDLTGDKASKSFVIYFMERKVQESSFLFPDIVLNGVRESTLAKYSQHLYWLETVLREETYVSDRDRIEQKFRAHLKIGDKVRRRFCGGTIYGYISRVNRKTVRITQVPGANGFCLGDLRGSSRIEKRFSIKDLRGLITEMGDSMGRLRIDDEGWVSLK